MRDFTSASVEYNCKMPLSWNNGNCMEELPDILLLQELCFPYNRSKKSNSKLLLSSCLICRVNQVYKWVCMKKHKSCPAHRVGGGRKKSKVHVFLQTHSWVRCERIISQKKKKSSLTAQRRSKGYQNVSLEQRPTSHSARLEPALSTCIDLFPHPMKLQATVLLESKKSCL